MLPLTPEFSRKLTANRIACCPSSAPFHTLALPGLRWDYARRRAALRGSTSSTSLATPSWIMCGMKHIYILDLSTCCGIHAVIVSRLAPTTLDFISLRPIWRRNTKLADTSPTACDLHNPLHSPRKPPDHPQTYAKYIDSHLPGRLPSSRCIPSAPSNTAKQRPLDYRGAPDTALGLRDNFRPGFTYHVAMSQHLFEAGEEIRFLVANNWFKH